MLVYLSGAYWPGPGLSTELYKPLLLAVPILYEGFLFLYLLV